MTVASALPSRLTIADARVALAALEPAIAKNGNGGAAFTVDASALAAFDTSAIAVLLELRRQAQALGRTLAVHGAPAAMVELAGLYGVAELLGFDATA
ncbi:MAG: STAS domain-containing protein [Aquincola sp.]|nr:STAS domain-containing protein [Aquincola sp.]MDH4288998.1 STAS domain-containing protein [Aquincola sp.]